MNGVLTRPFALHIEEAIIINNNNNNNKDDRLDLCSHICQRPMMKRLMKHKPTQGDQNETTKS